MYAPSSISTLRECRYRADKKGTYFSSNRLPTIPQDINFDVFWAETKFSSLVSSSMSVTKRTHSGERYKRERKGALIGDG